MSRQINKLLQILKLKRTMKQENVLSMIAGVVLGVCAMLLFPSTIPNHLQTSWTLPKHKQHWENQPHQQPS